MGELEIRPAKVFLILIGVGSIGVTQAAYIKCYHCTMENRQATPLESPLPLLNNTSCIDKALDTVMYVHGFTGSETSNDSVLIITAYLSLCGPNVLLLDWAEEASEANLGPLLGYARAVSNVEKVGKKLATALLALANAGLNLDTLHLVGHSLGAQLLGVAGKEVRSDQGPRIRRITGLDPAGPLFDGPISVSDKLSADCAKFVDVVHTDPGAYGTRESVGTVDFWPNYNPIKVIQPGCPAISLSTDDTFCSHKRSFAFFRESIFNGTSFLGSGQNNYATWIKNNGTTDRVEPLGEFVSFNASGNFYLVTNSASPYGKGKDGLTPNVSGPVG